MKTERAYVFSAVADERRHIASLIDGLDDRQLATPSLCAGWDIKTVAAHVLSTIADGLPAFLRLAVRRASLARAIDELARRRAQMTAPEIAAGLRRYADCPISPPLFGPLDPLADVLVHSGDIRIPLGLPLNPAPVHAALALDFLTGPWPFGFVPLGQLRGIRLESTDIDRVWGKGANIRGPVAALMMTVAGRTALVGLLEGAGLPILRHRLAPTAARQTGGQ
ncbi:MAG: maleylpyruvate isomerase family mycothiol-dependent enzyme [Mycobacterium sp.]|nr:maleylpyruvate isomerase family mycothiol-dependent enzyme [Mycobacterium sp.]